MIGTDPLAPLLEQARSRVEDLSFSFVKEWKTQHPNRLAVGYLPIYVPRPLLEALNVLPVALFGGGDQLDIIRGDSYFQSYMCHIPRSTLELGFSDALDALDGLIFPSTCDVIRNLQGMWQILFPQRWSAYLDLPQDFSPGTGGAFYQQQLHQLAHSMARLGAKPLRDKRLRAAIQAENERQQWLNRLNALRQQEPWRLRASEAYLLTRAGGLMTAAEHTALLATALEAVGRRNNQPIDNVRVILRGAFCEQPPLALIRALEKASCDILDDDFQLGLQALEGPISETGSPLEALARAFLEQGKATACRYIGEASKGAALVETVRRSRADGVIFAAASFCDPALLDQPMLEAALEKAGIPFTSFKFSENTGQFQVIREQAGAFSDAVKLWGAAG